ncbi:alkaline protease [Myriangium duriaei CBS 260.36]|uniref:Alkaline protease n=1 Tax=Myriangium duriaei CBS 260.36 TaxID=1168546 RepID=A0A9P4IVT8_9PEZI|nr:alkaline protease [Myriangium duriaei CBS 260.36]
MASHELQFQDVIEAISSYRAYAGHFHSSVITLIEQNKDVKCVEADSVWTAATFVEQKAVGYGLSLISHRSDGATKDYIYDNSGGLGTYAYVVDSGINVEHRDFANNVNSGGRASLGYNAMKKVPFKDVSGHGTHIAGLIGGTEYGVAKKCNLIAVKVLQGGGAKGAVILDGFQWAVNDILQKRLQSKAVINVSVIGPYMQAFNDAVDMAFNKGITTVAAAGNTGEKASTISPGSADGAITVAATDRNRQRASFSNWGPAVNLFAPGVDIKSDSITKGGGGRYSTATLSGTSQASAYVAGLVLYHKRLQSLPDARKTMTYIMHTALKGVVRSPKATANLFAYNGSGK